MGYECGFKAYRKEIIDNHTNGTLSDYLWNTKKEMIEAFKEKSKYKYLSPTEVQKIVKKDEYGYYTIGKDFDFWCSIGRYISDFMNHEKIYTKSEGEYDYIIDKDNIIKLLCKLNRMFLNPNNIKHYDIVNGVIEEDDENYRLVHIDGIEFQNTETGEYNRIISCDECTDLDYIDLVSDLDGVYTSLIMCLCDILENTDFDKETIVFWESY